MKFEKNLYHDTKRKINLLIYINKIGLIAFLIPFLLTAASYLNAESIVQSIPVLSVTCDSAANYVGKCNNIPMSFDKLKDPNAMPILSVSEDTPTGAGESIRASLWLALMVASMDANCIMKGAKASVHIEGKVDGPSAGAGFCLAFMSYLKGKALPEDFAITGTVLPDGSMGAVGSIIPKIDAAAEAGKKKMYIPNTIHIEKDTKSGKNVDLFEYGKSKNIMVIYIDNIKDCYLSLFGLVMKYNLKPELEVLSLPATLESFYRRKYEVCIESGDNKYGKITEEERKVLLEDNFFSSMISLANVADCHYLSGDYAYASVNAFNYNCFMYAREKAIALLKSTTQEMKNSEDVMKYYSDNADKIMNDLPDAKAVADKIIASKYSLPTLQLFDGFNYKSSYAARIEQVKYFMRINIDTLVNNPPEKEAEKKEFAVVIDNLGFSLPLYASWAEVESSLFLKNNDILARQIDLGILTNNPKSNEIETFFYNALVSSDSAFEAEVVKTDADILNESVSTYRYNLMNCMPSYLTYRYSYSDSINMHQSVGEATGEYEKKAMEVLAAQLHVKNIASILAISVALTEWEPVNFTDYPMNYKNTSKVNYFLNNARKNALIAILECQFSKIPSYSAVMLFREADCKRDATGTDKADILASYWHATLQSKLLKMMFSK